MNYTSFLLLSLASGPLLSPPRVREIGLEGNRAHVIYVNARERGVTEQGGRLRDYQTV